jgi:putative flippase GtrA
VSRPPVLPAAASPVVAPPRVRLRAELVRIARFCVVGASNTAVTFTAFAVLVAIGLPAPAASALAFVLGAANGYVWNTRWTFADQGVGASIVPRYVAVQVACAALSAVGVAVARGDGLARLAAEVVILPWVTLLAYALSRTLVFRRSAR